MPRFLILLLSCLLLTQTGNAQNYRSHILFHMRYADGYFADSVSGRQWGPYNSSSPAVDRFGQPSAAYFGGGDGWQNRVVLKNLKIKSLQGHGLTILFWHAFQRSDSANRYLFAIDSLFSGTSVTRPCGKKSVFGYNTDPDFPVTVDFAYWANYNCYFPLQDSLEKKNRLLPHTWNYHFFSMSDTALRFGLNDTLWKVPKATILAEGCEFPLVPYTQKSDSLDEIRLNCVLWTSQFTPPDLCDGSDFEVDKFVYWGDVIVFDTAYGPADFENLRNFPDTATTLVLSNKDRHSGFLQNMYRYNRAENRLSLINSEMVPQVERVMLSDLVGREIGLPTGSSVTDIRLPALAPSLYRLCIQLRNGEVRVEKFLVF